MVATLDPPPRAQARARAASAPPGGLDPGQAEALADMFHLLGDANRLRILFLCLERPLAVSDMARRLNLTLSLVSHNLRLLRAARLVRAKRRGKQVFYRAADAHVHRVVTDMVEHMAEPAADGA